MPPLTTDTGDRLVRLARIRTLARSGGARAIRMAAGISAAELAAAVDVDRATVSRWERGVQVPTGDAAMRWLEVLDRLAAR